MQFKFFLDNFKYRLPERIQYVSTGFSVSPPLLLRKGNVWWIQNIEILVLTIFPLLSLIKETIVCLSLCTSNACL